MKIRNGFVSNSSSSSFTCDICYTKQEGMDWELSLETAGMVEFTSGDCCCEYHLREFIRINKLEKEFDEWQKKDHGYYNWRECIPPEYSPVQNGLEVTDYAIITYLLKKVNMSRCEVVEEMIQKVTDGSK